MKESWLEIYKVPKDTWVKEVETAVATVGARSRKPTMVESTPPVSSFLNKFLFMVLLKVHLT